MILAGNARADTLNTGFNTTLASPGSGSPGWYNGSPGNPQGNWTVANDGNIELGLRAKYRRDVTIVPSDDDYLMQAGGCYLSPTCTGNNAPSTTIALWNYEFSVNLRAGGTEGLTFANTSTTLTIADLTKGTTTGPFDPFGKWSDSAVFGSSGAGSQSPGIDWSKYWGIQNSENLGFSDGPLVGFNPNNGDLYQFTLAVEVVAGDYKGEKVFADMEVQATPEPASILLFGTLLGAVALACRKRMA